MKRTHEVGIRVTLGAKRAGIVRLVLSETALMCAIGIATGTAAALACGKYAESLLFGLHPNDPGVLAVRRWYSYAWRWLLAACLPSVLPR